jgi:hypothetical protein
LRTIRDLTIFSFLEIEYRESEEAIETENEIYQAEFNNSNRGPLVGAVIFPDYKMLQMSDTKATLDYTVRMMPDYAVTQTTILFPPVAGYGMEDNGTCLFPICSFTAI